MRGWDVPETAQVWCFSLPEPCASSLLRAPGAPSAFPRRLGERGLVWSRLPCGAEQPRDAPAKALW